MIELSKCTATPVGWTDVLVFVGHVPAFDLVTNLRQLKVFVRSCVTNEVWTRYNTHVPTDRLALGR